MHIISINDLKQEPVKNQTLKVAQESDWFIIIEKNSTVEQTFKDANRKAIAFNGKFFKGTEDELMDFLITEFGEDYAIEIQQWHNQSMFGAPKQLLAANTVETNSTFALTKQFIGNYQLKNGKLFFSTYNTDIVINDPINDPTLKSPIHLGGFIQMDMELVKGKGFRITRFTTDSALLKEMILNETTELTSEKIQAGEQDVQKNALYHLNMVVSCLLDSRIKTKAKKIAEEFECQSDNADPEKLAEIQKSAHETVKMLANPQGVNYRNYSKQANKINHYKGLNVAASLMLGLAGACLLGFSAATTVVSAGIFTPLSIAGIALSTKLLASAATVSASAGLVSLVASGLSFFHYKSGTEMSTDNLTNKEKNTIGQLP